MLLPGIFCVCCLFSCPHMAKNLILESRAKLGASSTSASAFDDLAPFFFIQFEHDLANIDSYSRQTMGYPSIPHHAASLASILSSSGPIAVLFASLRLTAGRQHPSSVWYNSVSTPFSGTYLQSVDAHTAHKCAQLLAHCVHDCGSSKPLPLYVSRSHCRTSEEQHTVAMMVWVVLLTSHTILRDVSSDCGKRRHKLMK